jgi:hypothetical protein
VGFPLDRDIYLISISAYSGLQDVVDYFEPS